MGIEDEVLKTRIWGLRCDRIACRGTNRIDFADMITTISLVCNHEEKFETNWWLMLVGLVEMLLMSDDPS
jgi:hypothetical protein